MSQFRRWCVGLSGLVLLMAGSAYAAGLATGEPSLGSVWSGVVAGFEDVPAGNRAWALLPAGLLSLVFISRHRRAD
jgi:hypothetical protein